VQIALLEQTPKVQAKGEVERRGWELNPITYDGLWQFRGLLNDRALYPLPQTHLFAKSEDLAKHFKDLLPLPPEYHNSQGVSSIISVTTEMAMKKKTEPKSIALARELVRVVRMFDATIGDANTALEILDSINRWELVRGSEPVVIPYTIV
jgi:hypothetical protein